MELETLLKKVQLGEVEICDAVAQLQGIDHLGFARIDQARKDRTGFGEVIYGPGKSVSQLETIFSQFKAQQEPCLATLIDPEVARPLCESDPSLEYNRAAQTLVGPWGTPASSLGPVAILSAGTSDLKVVEEAAAVAQFLGAQVSRFEDVGVAGVHRLFEALSEIKQAEVIIVVAGMDGALASVVGGLVKQPVIAVPTSVGYGAGFEGLAPLLSMLNSCASGVTVVNIDNGFGAAMAAAKVLLSQQQKR